MGDKDAFVFESTLTPTHLALERVISKVFTHYSISLEITEDIQVTFKSKLLKCGRRGKNSHSCRMPHSLCYLLLMQKTRTLLLLVSLRQ